MPYYKFGPDDIFYNKLETRPSVNFKIYDRKVYYNNQGNVTGEFTSSVGAQNGYISLYELNVDRASGQLIYPFIVKDGSLTSFSTISTTKFNNDFVYGDKLTGSYPLMASISSDRSCQGCDRLHVNALRNALNFYKVLSDAYSYSSSLGDKSDQELRLISIPSIFYGSEIKKGTVSLKFYVTGVLQGELKDSLKNGELKQVLSSSDGSTVTPTGSVGGVVLYNEGFILLTGSWPISNHVEPYVSGDSKPRWIDFGSTGSAGSGGENLPATSFDMSFSGTTNIPVLTMFAHAREGQLNHSNNPTSISRDNRLYLLNQTSASTQYSEPTSVTIKNIGSSSFQNTIPTYEKTVFISQIGIYDEDKNLIAVAKLANPVRKRNQDDFTFKLKLDF